MSPTRAVCVVLTTFAAGCGQPPSPQIPNESDWEAAPRAALPPERIVAQVTPVYEAPSIVVHPAERRGPCPPEMALVGTLVCVDRWEGALVEEQPDGGEVAWSPYEPPSRATGDLRAVSLPNVVPQAFISGEEAADACHVAGKRLCTSAEWQSACVGRHATTYPYGDERVEGTCNDDGRKGHPVVEANRQLGLPKERMWHEGMLLPLINQLPDTLEPTGSHAGCKTTEGAFDMVGNLHEWVADIDGTFNGGFYMDTLINGEGCMYSTTAHPMSYADYSTGFRCCRDPETASVSTARAD